jgi:hypothetical protein
MWPAAVRGKELAVALSTMPDSTSSNAWPARPCQAFATPYLWFDVTPRFLQRVELRGGTRLSLRLGRLTASGAVHKIKTGAELTLGYSWTNSWRPGQTYPPKPLPRRRE